MLVAENSGSEIVDFASEFIAWYSWIGKSLYLDDLYIVEKFRGAGLGTALIEEALIMVRKENC